MLRKLSVDSYGSLFGNSTAAANALLYARQPLAMNAANQPQHYFGAGDPSIASPTAPKLQTANGGAAVQQAAASKTAPMTANPFGSGAQKLKPTTASPHGSKKLLGNVSPAVKNPASSVKKMVRTKPAFLLPGSSLLGLLARRRLHI